MEFGPQRTRYTASRPPELELDDILTFVEHPTFTRDWRDLSLDDDDLIDLQLGIMASRSEALGQVDIGGLGLIGVRSEPRTYRPPISVMVAYVRVQLERKAVLLAADVPSEATMVDEKLAQVWALVNEIELDLS